MYYIIAIITLYVFIISLKQMIKDEKEYRNNIL